MPEPERLQSLDDLAPTIELYHHTVRAGQYDEACQLLQRRLVPNPLHFQFGAYQLMIELKRALFPDGEDRPPRLTDESAQAWTLNALANSYSLSGQPRRAVPLFERDIAICERRNDKQNLVVPLGNVARNLIQTGALRAAEGKLRRRVALCRKIGAEFQEAGGLQEVGRLLAYRGAWGEAEEELAAALAVDEKEGDVQGQGITWGYRALRALLMARELPSSPGLRPPLPGGEMGERDTGEEALAAARRALELADACQRQVGRPNARDYVRVHWLLGAALRVCGEIDEAERHLGEALARCRAINLVETEADILIDLARLRARQGTAEEALLVPRTGTSESEGGRLAEEARALAERCGYVLQEADAHLVLARLALDTGDRRAARGHAQAARRLATCDGLPEYTYKVAYEEAGEVLRVTG